LRWQAKKMKRSPEWQMGSKGTRAEFRWAEKGKHNCFRNFLIQGNVIQIKGFEYFQTKFELDSK
jgi:hypothetical protein